jgi:hypothetical protein
MAMRKATRRPDLLVLLNNQKSSARGAWTQRRASTARAAPKGWALYLPRWVGNSPHPRLNPPQRLGGFRRRLTLSRPASGRPGGHSPNPNAPGSARRRRARPGRLRGSAPNWGHGARLGKGLAHAAASPTAMAGVGRLLTPTPPSPTTDPTGLTGPDAARSGPRSTGSPRRTPMARRTAGSWSPPTVLTTAARRL